MTVSKWYVSCVQNFTILILVAIVFSCKSFASETVVNATLFSSANVDQILAVLKKHEAVQAKNVRLGSKLRGVPYFHFKLSNENWSKLQIDLSQLGELVQTRRQTNGTGVRTILWLKDAQINKLIAFQNVQEGGNRFDTFQNLSVAEFLEANLKKGQITIYQNKKWNSKMGIRLRSIETKLTKFNQEAQFSIYEPEKCQLGKWLAQHDLKIENAEINVKKENIDQFLINAIRFGSVTLGVSTLKQNLKFKVDPKSLDFRDCEEESAKSKTSKMESPTAVTEATPSPVVPAPVALSPSPIPAPVVQYEHELNFYTYLDQPQLRFTVQNGACELKADSAKLLTEQSFQALEFNMPDPSLSGQIDVACMNRQDRFSITKKMAKEIEVSGSAVTRKGTSTIGTFEQIKYRQKLERPFSVSADSKLFQSTQLGFYLMASQNAADFGSYTSSEILYGKFEQNLYYGIALQNIKTDSVDSSLVGGAFAEYDLPIPSWDDFLFSGHKSLTAAARYYPLVVLNTKTSNNLTLEAGFKQSLGEKYHLSLTLQNQKLDYKNSSTVKDSSVDVSLTAAYLGLGYQF